MGNAKWIAGILGWVVFGPIGGLLGFVVGSALDNGTESWRKLLGGEAGQDGGPTYTRTYTRTYNQTGQRNSFLMSLLVLSSAVIRADGKHEQSEIDYVRAFVRRNFGDNAVDEAMRILNDLRYKEINIYEVGGQIAQYMNYSQRLQLFHYLVELAKADGSVCTQELDVLKSISVAIRLSSADTNSILAMFEQTRESAYKVLEIEPTATDDEVRKAYKRLAMKNHPDKVASLGPDVQKAAEEKFKKIQAAYETIKKERNL